MKSACIFISYRRFDAEGWAGRLSDSLKGQLGDVRIFRDIEEIPPGVDFVEYFTTAVAECDAFIEIVGRSWLSATDAKGRRRLDNPDDYTRLELATALKRNIRVIPVLLEGASMPTAEDLPEDLGAFARRNAYPLSDSHWATDTRKLADTLREIVQPAGNELPSPATIRSPTHTAPRPLHRKHVLVPTGAALLTLIILGLWPADSVPSVYVGEFRGGKWDPPGPTLSLPTNALPNANATYKVRTPVFVREGSPGFPLYTNRRSRGSLSVGDQIRVSKVDVVGYRRSQIWVHCSDCK